MKTNDKKEHPLKALRRAGVPLGLIETSDMSLTISGCIKSLNGKAETTGLIQWDMMAGPVGLNLIGKEWVNNLSETEMMSVGNPSEMLRILSLQGRVPENTIVFFENVHAFISEISIKQGIYNLRDKFKSVGSLLLMLAPAIKLPDELKNDVVVIEEALPDAEEIKEIVRRILTDAGLPLEEEKRETKIVTSLLGLNGFASEQVLSLALSKQGVNLESVLERRRKFISQQSGMEIRTDKIRFSDIAGYQNVKELLTQKIRGKRPPGLILWIDEAEKAFAGSNTDTSGTTQDQVATLLTWMQDRLNEDRLSALLEIGFPGTGKSAIAMALRNEAECECIRLDMGAMKGSLVGQSEQQIRAIIKTIDALCYGHILVVSTANSMANIPSSFISRHALGTYFFDLPDAEEGRELWKLKRAKYGIPESDETPVNTVGWTGREIQQCCFLAGDIGYSLNEASRRVSPFCRSGAAEIDALRKAAKGNWISASQPGLYTGPSESKGASTGARKFEV